MKNLSLTYDDIGGASKSTVTFGTTSGTACEGNDSRLSDARPWTGAFNNGHKPVETPDADGNVDTTRLSEIISLAHQKGFRFVTMRELFLGP